MAETKAQINRRIRQEALREQLSKQKHIEHVIEMVEIIRKPSDDFTNDMLARYKVAIDTKLKLINKYLPDLKASEITGPGGDPIEIDHHWTIEVVDAEDEDTEET